VRFGAWLGAAVALLLALVGAVLELAGGAGLEADEAFSFAYVLIAGPVGALVASRHRRNPIGWILVGLTVWAGVDAFVRGLAEYLLAEGYEVWGERAAWVSAWSFVPFFFVPAVFLPLLFPDGRLPSPRFRPVAWAAVMVIAFWILTTAVDPGPVPKFDDVENPFGIDSRALQVASDAVAPLMFACLFAAVASVISRVRRATALERQQLKWLAAAAVFAIVTLIVAGIVSDDESAGGVFFTLAVIGLPLAIGVAILRYRLYDIDFVISHTLVYVPLIAIIGGISTALIPLSQRVYHRLTGEESDAMIVALALIVAALIAPLRKRLEGLVERRFRVRPAGANHKELLEDPALVALVESIAQRAAREAVRELDARRR
jgi:hypothetical protein